MPEYLSPGVYVEELPGNQPIVGVSTSIAGMVGLAERGPVNVPILVTSYGEYVQWFGDILPIDDFSNSMGGLCYLPYAVQGFFTNGGSMLYVVRVLDPTAVNASVDLFDRGDPLSASTALLRSAGANTATVAAPPPLSVLDTTGLTSGTWFRIGDGSNAEYRQVDTTAIDHTLIPLDVPLARSHAATVTIQDWELSTSGSPTALTVVADVGSVVAAGNSALHLTSTNATDITNALKFTLPQAVQIGYNEAPLFRREYRYVTQIIQLGANDIEIVLDGPLSLSYQAGAPIAWVDLPSPPPASTVTQTLGIDASAGDNLIFAGASLIGFDSPSHLVVIDAGSSSPEIRRIGQLAQLTLNIPTYASYPAGSVVEKAFLPAEYELSKDYTAGDSAIFLVGGEAFAGVSLTVSDGTSSDTVTGTASVAETLTLDSEIANPYVITATPIVGISLNGTAFLGDTSIPVNNTTGLEPGMPLALSSGGADPVMEAVTVASVGANTVTVHQGLKNTYNSGATLTNLNSATVTIAIPLAADVAVNNTVINVTSVNGLAVGMALVLADAGVVASASLTVVSIDATQSTITVTPASPNLYPQATSTLTGTLTLAAPIRAGDTVIALAGFHDLAPGQQLTITDGTSTDTPVIQSAALSSALALSSGLANSYSTASTIVSFAASPNQVVMVAVNKGDTQVQVDSTDGLAAGLQITIDPTGANPEAVNVQALGPGNTIVIAPPAAFAHNQGVKVVVATVLALASAVTAGTSSNVVSLTSRLGLLVGDLLQLGTAPNQEYVTIQALPQRGAAPDAGTVILSTALQQSYSLGTQVQRIGKPLVGYPSNIAQAALMLAAPAGTNSLLISDGSNTTSFAFADNAPNAVDAKIRVTTPTGQVYYHMIGGNTLVTPGDITVQAPVLENSHAAGEPSIGRNPLIQVQALDAGGWGNRLQISVQDEASGLVAKTTLAQVIPPNQLKLASPAGVQVGTVLELFNLATGDTIAQLKVDAFNRANFIITLDKVLTIDQLNAFTPPGAVGVRSREFKLTVSLLQRPDPSIPARNTQVIGSETFRWLSMDPRHSNYFQTIIGFINGPPRLSDGRPDGQSNYIRVLDINPQTTVRLGPEALIDVLPDGRRRPAVQTLENGDDAVPQVTPTTFIGADSPDPVDRSGLFALTNINEISMIAVPGQVDVTIQQALVDQSELLLYRMAVLDGPPPPDDAMADVMAQRQSFDTKYAALYHPWLLIPDPFPQNLNNIGQFAIPPAGHVMGIYANVDVTRGVYKAPANELVNGITGLQRTLNKSDQDILNPYPVNINVIRDFRKVNRGIRVYGARIISSDTDWKYVNVRRLMMFIEASLYQGLQPVVFEPNAQPLWARVRRTVSDFLDVVWRNGALQGASAAEAYYVKCDQTTMTQTEIDNGELIILVGVAPVMPAEFVIVRIGFFTANAGS